MSAGRWSWRAVARGVVSGSIFGLAIGLLSLPAIAQDAGPEGIGSPPSAPQNLVATPGNGQVDLAWDAPNDPGIPPLIQNYRVYRNGSLIHTTLTALEESFTDTGRPNGTSINYEVRAFNGQAEGAGATTSATPVGPPSAPQNFTAVAGPLPGRVTVNFSASASNGGSPITAYRVYRNDVQVESTTTVPAQFTHLFNPVTGETYSYRVSAVNDEGETSTLPVDVVPFRRPDPPTNVVATPHHGAVELTWDAPEFDGGRPITEYVVRRGNINIATANPITGTAFTDTGRTNGTTYTYRVIAVNVGGSSDPSTPAVSATPQASTGFIRIRLATTPTPSSQAFAFQTTGSGVAPFTLDAAATATFPSSKRFPSSGGLAPGTYSFTQNPVGGWETTSIVCNTGETVDLANRKVTINLGEDEQTTCTFTVNRRQPDAKIATSTSGPFFSNNVYSGGSPGNQTRSLGARPVAPAVFTVAIQNDGGELDDVKVKAVEAGSTRFTVRYLDGSTNVTAAVLAGTYVIEDLAPGATRTLTVRMTPQTSAARGASRTATITATSVGSPVIRTKDTVRAKATRT